VNAQRRARARPRDRRCLSDSLVCTFLGGFGLLGGREGLAVGPFE
jgi:hypothetical protein